MGGGGQYSEEQAACSRHSTDASRMKSEGREGLEQAKPQGQPRAPQGLEAGPCG